MWSELEDIIELTAAVLVIVAAVLAASAKVWRAVGVINRIVESNLIERLDVLLAKSELAQNESDKQLNLKRVG
jgi:uncharacterized membrane protein